MSSQDDNQDQRVVTIVVIGAVLLAIGLALGVGIHQSRKASMIAATSATRPGSLSAVNAGAAPTFGPGSTIAVGEASAVPAAASPEALNQPRVVVDSGVVTFYFATGKTDLAPGAREALADAIAAAQAGKNLTISGFHDATGDAAINAELAKNRAMSVRDALVNAGVPADNLELMKPEQSTGTGNDAQARRVEVRIAR